MARNLTIFLLFQTEGVTVETGSCRRLSLASSQLTPWPGCARMCALLLS